MRTTLFAARANIRYPARFNDIGRKCVLIIAIGPAVECGAATFWFWATCLIGLVWLKRHIDLIKGRNEPVLQPDEPGVTDAELPGLTVLVAAKDEEDNIGRCVEGLLRQEYPNVRFIVTDDRSNDRTGAIIDELAARDERLKAIHVETLPPDWFGKNHAMHTGMRRAESELLCFTDADCAFDSPHLLAAAVRYTLREKVDFLSVLPRLETETLWERVIQPVAGAIMVFWFPPQKVNSSRSSRAYANGAFMLMTRKTYDALGGHAAVKQTLNEDMHMARLVKAIGRRLRVIRGGDLYRVRMYTGFAQIWKGWSRIFFGCFGTFPRLLVSFLMLSIFSLSPYLTLCLSPLAGVNWWWFAGAGAFAILSQQSILWRFYGISGNGPPWAMTYPIGAAFCLGMTLNAMRRLGGKVTTTWRGTTYQGGSQTST